MDSVESKDIQTAVRCEKKFHKEIKIAAAKEGISMNWWMVRALKHYLTLQKEEE